MDFIVKSAPTRENVVDREKLGYVDLSADDVGPEETADQGEDREGGERAGAAVPRVRRLPCIRFRP